MKLFVVVPLALSIFSIACVKRNFGDATTQSSAGIVDQASPDITVLKVFNTKRALGSTADLPLDFSDCKERPDSYGPYFDCTQSVEKHIAEKFPQIAAPLAGPVVARADADGGRTVSSYHCDLLEIQTLTRRAALGSAVGSGFNYNGQTLLIPKEKMKKIGEATLKSGESADIHRFLAPAFCWRGSATSSMMATYSFKPFLDFEGPNGKTFRNWDQVEKNYEVKWQMQGFDRTAELTTGSASSTANFKVVCNNGAMVVDFSRKPSGLEGFVTIHDQGVVNHFRSTLGNEFSDSYNGIGVSVKGGNVFCKESENSCDVTGQRSSSRLVKEGNGYLFEIKSGNALAKWIFESCQKSN